MHTLGWCVIESLCLENKWWMSCVSQKFYVLLSMINKDLVPEWLMFDNRLLLEPCCFFINDDAQLKHIGWLHVYYKGLMLDQCYGFTYKRLILDQW